MNPLRAALGTLLMPFVVMGYVGAALVVLPFAAWQSIFPSGEAKPRRRRTRPRRPDAKIEVGTDP